MDISYLDYRRRWLKTVARELGTDPDWGVTKDPETQRWTVHTYSTGGILIDVTCNVPYNDDLNNFPYEWRSWFNNYALAEAKCIVGESRSKFDKIPVAGTFMGMNGAALKAEGTNEKARLIEDIKASRIEMLFPRWAVVLLPMLLALGANLIC